MTLQPSRIITSLPRIAAAIAALLGVLVLIGWAWDLPALKSVLPALVSMKANTALCFLLAGSSLWLLQVEDLSEAGVKVQLSCAGVVCAVGALTLGQYLFGRDLGIDQLLFKEAAGGIWTSSPGRMAPATALSFLLIGSSLLLRSPYRFIYGQVTAVATGLIGLYGVMGYAAGVESLYGIASYTSMAVHTAAAFVVLSVGLLAHHVKIPLSEIKKSSKTFALIGGLFAMGLVGGAFSLSWGSARSLLDSSKWVDHTQEVRALAAECMGLLMDSQTATRGFILTGQEKFLEPHHAAVVLIEPALEQLARLVADNPAQSAHVSRLRAAARQEQEWTRGELDARRGKGFEAARSRVLTGEGKQRMDLVRSITAGILEMEESLLRARREKEVVSARRAAMIIILTGCLSLLLLAVAGFVLFREIDRRTILEEELSRRTRTLETALAQEKRSQAELQTLNGRLRRQAQELEGANTDLESFSFSVSHDLRAPLRSIDGFSQVLLADCHDDLDAEGKDALARIRRAAQKMGELIDSLLVLSRVTRAPLLPQSVDLSALAEAVAQELQERDPARAVRFRTTGGIRGDGDPHLLRIVLDNLLGNAWKYTARTPEAEVEFGSALQPDRPRSYFVRDNGAGFDMAYAGKLFGAFQRLHASNEFPGNGIGLATVARIIRRHGGKVWAEGAVGKGAAFYFNLGEASGPDGGGSYAGSEKP